MAGPVGSVDEPAAASFFHRCTAYLRVRGLPGGLATGGRFPPRSDAVDRGNERGGPAQVPGCPRPDARAGPRRETRTEGRQHGNVQAVRPRRDVKRETQGETREERVKSELSTLSQVGCV